MILALQIHNPFQDRRPVGSKSASKAFSELVLLPLIFEKLFALPQLS